MRRWAIGTDESLVSQLQHMLQDLKKLATLLKLEYLENYCSNIENDMDFLNPSIGTYLSDERGAKCLKLFFNKATFSDVSFKLNAGGVVPAHSAILWARCKVLDSSASSPSHFQSLRDSLGGGSLKFNAAEGSFLPSLTYIYSDHSPIEGLPSLLLDLLMSLDSDSLGILATARRLDLSRLICLCELYISKEIERETRNDIVKVHLTLFS